MSALRALRVPNSCRESIQSGGKCGILGQLPFKIDLLKHGDRHRLDRYVKILHGRNLQMMLQKFLSVVMQWLEFVFKFVQIQRKPKIGYLAMKLTEKAQ